MESKAVTIYTKPGCPFCARAKQELDLQGIVYKEIDASASPEAKAELVRVSGQAQVPVTVRGDRVELPAGGS